MSSPSRQEVERKLRTFVVEELIEERYDGRDPLATGAVDSLAMEQLVEYVEEEFDLALADEEMVEENFESIAALAALVDQRLGTASA